DEVPGQRRLDGGRERFGVTNLADHDDVGILPKDRAQPLGEGEAGLLVDLTLVGAGQLVFDRVFYRGDVLAGLHQFAQRTVEGRWLATSCRPGDQDQPFGLPDDLA